MINRRILRIKAVKNLYAFENCRQANYELVIDKIKSDFAHDLNSMEPYDAEKMRSRSKEAVRYFENMFAHDPEDVVVEKEAKDSAESGYNQLNSLNQNDIGRIKKELTQDFDKIRQSQLMVWKLVKEFCEQNKKIVEEKVTLSQKFGQPAKAIIPLYHNKVVAKIFDTPEVAGELTRESFDWSNDEDKVRGWYKSVLRKNDFFEGYLAKSTPTENQDYEAIDELIRNLIFKNDAIENFFDERDINWNENKQIVRSLVLKTLKSVKEEGVIFPPLSYNWEEDLEYYTDLFAKTIINNEYYESLIEKKVQNWKLERLASLDRIILKVAICEMINFPSIPVKVTINEFIEISKTYSTPKSKKFVNGLLDAISEDLINSGEIKKSGRGLIDSK